MKLAYFNKDDPKIFVYKCPGRKWMGVTLNFAHPKAWRLLVFMMLFPMVFLLPCILALTVWIHPKPRAVLWFSLFGAMMALNVLYAAFLTFHAFRMAAKDAQNHPAP